MIDVTAQNQLKILRWLGAARPQVLPQRGL
jgi:hypothetical protein